MTRFKLTIALISVLGMTSGTLASPGSPPPSAAPATPSCPAPSTTPSHALPTPSVPATPMSTAVFEGCWTQFPSGTCRGIFRVGTTYKICGACGSTGSPPTYNGSCTTISAQTLATGYWCS